MTPSNFIGDKMVLWEIVAQIRMKPKPTKDDIERLSRGEPTRARIGRRSVGHRLTQKERILFRAAQRQGFLKIPAAGIRPNVANIYRLWCEAEGRECIIQRGGEHGLKSPEHSC